jgi:hypothetical protein
VSTIECKVGSNVITSPHTFAVGTTTVQCKATSGVTPGASCSFTTTVNDTEKPTISAPADASYQCASEVPVANASQATASDNSGAPAVTVSEANNGGVGSTASPLIITRTYTATDNSNNTQTATQTITIIDNTKPTVNAPAPTSVSANSSCQVMIPNVLAGSTASDNCGGNVTLTQSPAAGTLVGLGLHTITVTATDAAGNTKTNTTTLTVNDTTAPVITRNGLATITVECHTSFTDPSATATDSCSGQVTVSTSGTVNINMPGTYTLTYTAKDTANNPATPVTRTVKVVDTIAPIITLTGLNPMTVEAKSSFTDPGATASDNCGGNFSATASGAVNINVVGTYTITYTAKDAAYNAATPVTRTVKVVDTTPPTIACPSGIKVDAVSPAGAVVTYPQPSASDNVSAVTVSCSKPSGGAFPVGVTPVQCTAGDASQNTASCAFNVTVLGAQAIEADVLNGLKVLRQSVTDKQDGKKLDDVIGNLTSALDPTLWIDQMHLVPKKGEKVFHETRDAVEKLRQLLKDKKSVISNVVLQSFVDRLLRVGRLLAQVALSEATAARADAKKIAAITQQLFRGDSDATAGKYSPAIEHYREVWKQALTALGKI